MPSVVAFQCNRQNRWHKYWDISLIVVTVTYLVDLVLGIVFSPQLLVWFGRFFTTFDTKSFTVCANVFLGKFVNSFYADDETITYNTHSCPMLMGVCWIPCPV